MLEQTGDDAQIQVLMEGENSSGDVVQRVVAIPLGLSGASGEDRGAIFLRQVQQAPVSCPAAIKAFDDERPGLAKGFDTGCVGGETKGAGKLQTVKLTVDAFGKVEPIGQFCHLGLEQMADQCRAMEWIHGPCCQSRALFFWYTRPALELSEEDTFFRFSKTS